jgi:hypothetical protein
MLNIFISEQSVQNLNKKLIELRENDSEGEPGNVVSKFICFFFSM